jgi:hypothetical protein
MALDTVNLQNNDWDTINVQATQGNNADPTSNTSLGAKTLTNGQVWVISSDGENVYYCRDTNPNAPDGTWTPWTLCACDGTGQVFNINL